MMMNNKYPLNFLFSVRRNNEAVLLMERGKMKDAKELFVRCLRLTKHIALENRKLKLPSTAAYMPRLHWVWGDDLGVSCGEFGEFIYQRPLYIEEDRRLAECQSSSASELITTVTFNLALLIQLEALRTGSSAALLNACQVYEIAFELRLRRKQAPFLLLDMAILNNCGQARIQLSCYVEADKCMKNLTKLLRLVQHHHAGDDLQEAEVRGFSDSALWKIPECAASA